MEKESKNHKKMRKGDWIMTFSGIKMYPLDPQPEEIVLEDIAHALSNICRFTGHTNRFYSVAQHSVYVSVYASPDNALWGLLHDASEAFLCDIARPVKRFISEYSKYEENLMRVIADKFNLSWPMPEEIKSLDKRMLMTEARDLGINTRDWAETAKPMPITIFPQTPEGAERSFHDWFCVIRNKGNCEQSNNRD